jgi:hypothetical protein
MRVRVLLTTLLLAVGATPLLAQGLVGRVSDESGAPISGAEVRVGGVGTIGRTDASGWFRVADAPLGLMYFGVRRLGYRPVAELVRLAAGDTVDVVLETLRAELDTVRVQARADAAWERELRRYSLAVESARFGTVVTESDIATRRPVWTSDLFLTMGGFSVRGSGPSARVLGRAGCTPTIILDGLPAPGFNVNDIPPSAVRLLVAYRSFALVPSLWQGPNSNPNCGAIAIFTL